MAEAHESAGVTSSRTVNGRLSSALMLLGIFAIVGVTLGLAGYGGLSMLTEELVDGAEGQLAQGIGQMLVVVLFIQSSLTTVFLGPVIGALGSTIIGISQPRDSAILTGTIASFVGFLVMVALAVVIMTMALPTGDGTGGSTGSAGDIGQISRPILYSAVPTAIAGGVGGLIGSRL